MEDLPVEAQEVIEIVYEKPFSHPLDFQFLYVVKGVFFRPSGNLFVAPNICYFGKVFRAASCPYLTLFEPFRMKEIQNSSSGK